MTGQANLRFRIAAACERPGFQSEPLITNELDCLDCHQFRLIKATLPSLAGMKRHRNQRDLRPHMFSQRCDRLRQQAPQRLFCGQHTFIFEQMDQATQLPIVTTIGDSSREGRSRPPAKATFDSGNLLGKRGEYPFPAERAEKAADGLDTRNALRTNRQSGDGYEGSSAKAAIGRKQSGKETVRQISGGRNQKGQYPGPP